MKKRKLQIHSLFLYLLTCQLLRVLLRFQSDRDSKQLHKLEPNEQADRGLKIHKVSKPES
jgi:hypothetical protein